MGFSFAAHYCGGKAVKMNLVLDSYTLDCGMKKMKPSCENEQDETNVKKKGCCENEMFSLQVEDDYQRSLNQPSLDFDFVFSFVHTFIQVLASQIDLKAPFAEYSPPLRSQDVLVLFQSFLI